MQEQRGAIAPTRESEAYLSEQILTYLGNKRALLPFIASAIEAVRRDLGEEKLAVADLFSGSGVVSRLLKRYARELYANDLENYCATINRCYLANRGEVDMETLNGCYRAVKEKLDTKPLASGFLSELYAPADDQNIRAGERVFFTTRNARYLDTARAYLEEIPEPYKTYLLAPLLYEASVHNNTGGVFKGFYKNSETGVGQYGGNGRNALTRILGEIELKLPLFSNFECGVHVLQKDANALARELPPLDLVYLDPPYNQHPYGSNYFMLNLLNDYRTPEQISRVSGIPADWNKSQYNKKQTAKESLFDLCKELRTKYLLVSFSSEGFIGKEEMTAMLSSLGKVRVLDREYNTFRACRNLSGRELHLKEYLYLVKKT